MTVCPSCGRDSPPEFSFCPGCGTRLSAESHVLAEGRKVVTILCCDLVSYTSHSEAADHELIDELLRRYNALAKRLVVGHGGVVEKFIGDAVLAVFGFPAAHDDDAERAVRAALKLAAAAGEMAWPNGDLVQVRIGVNSGETYVHLGVDPASGETFLTGDAVNTAARLQTAAAVGTVVVGELTQRLSAAAIAYEELPPVTVKGKREPLALWRPVEPRSRTGLRTTGAGDTPFFGRDAELRRLQQAFEAASAANQAQFVLLVGEPGIGKSRLVLELARTLEASPDLVTWRQGRCLPYGEGVSFAALAEILKAHAGILDSDDVAAVEAKLEAVLPEGADRPWLRQRLRPLLGLEAAQASREESFAAWRLFLGHIASSGPTVLVFEDLHWADEGMLAFVEHLVAEAVEAPLLVLGTTRPELLQRHPDVLASAPAVTRLTLAPLRRKDAARFVSSLLDERLAAAVRGPVLERIGGNPLYAEEYVRLLLDRGLLLKTRGVLRLKEGEALPLPDTVQAVLAARLDTLPPDQKALLCDAAVFGQSFWDGGVAALAGRDPADVRSGMAFLAERQLVRAVVSSSLAGETEYLFWHALARDVAYAELPKRARVQKHAAAAGWLEAKAGDRVLEYAQMLAHHSVTGMDLALALGDSDTAAELRGSATRHLTLAGDHTMRLDVAAAERYYSRAAELLPHEGPARAGVLVKWADALHECLRDREGAELLEEAAALLRATGDRRALAVCLISLSLTRRYLNDPRVEEPVTEALALLSDDPSPELVRVLNFAAQCLTLDREDFSAAAAMADRALLLARQLDMPVDVLALGARGYARVSAGDPRGLDDFRRAIEEAQAQGLLVASCYLHYNLGVNAFLWEGPAAQILWSTRALRLSRQCGSKRSAADAQTLLCEAQLGSGDWDALMAETADLVPALTEAGETWDLVLPHAARVLVSTDRDDDDDLGDSQAWLEGWAREGLLEDRPTCIAALAALALRRERPAEALDLLEKGLPDEVVSVNFRANLGTVLTRLARTAVALRRSDLAARFVAQIDAITPFDEDVRSTVAALIAEAEGRTAEAAAGFADAAARWHDFGVPYEAGQAWLGQGRCLVALGRAPEAAAPLAAAREIFARLGAKPALAETDDWLARADASS